MYGLSVDRYSLIWRGRMEVSNVLEGVLSAAWRAWGVRTAMGRGAKSESSLKRGV